MRIHLECMSCFVRQTLESVRMASEDPGVHERVLRKVLRELSEIDMRRTPPEMARQIHRLIREETGCPDPYDEVKRRFNRYALSVLPDLERRVREADDPLEMAVLVAIAGNVIDFGVHGHIDEDHVRDEVDQVAKAPLNGDIEELRTALSAAKTVLYLTDNAGEIVFDRLLMQEIRRLGNAPRITACVKGHPVLNDATLEDAREARLSELATVIDNGLDVPGTVVAESAPALQEAFREADVVLAKGQGNFETLNESARRIFFLFKAKCPLVARLANRPQGSMMLVALPPMAPGALTS